MVETAATQVQHCSFVLNILLYLLSTAKSSAAVEIQEKKKKKRKKKGKKIKVNIHHL